MRLYQSRGKLGVKRRLGRRPAAADREKAASWDTHRNNFETVRDLSQVLDPGWATLMGELFVEHVRHIQPFARSGAKFREQTSTVAAV
jgi:hypothetical protein